MRYSPDSRTLTSSERWVLQSDVGVGSLGLGTQAYNCVVERADILSIDRLCQETPQSLLRIHAMGPRWLAEIIVALGRRGRRLRDDGNIGAAVKRYIGKIEPDWDNLRVVEREDLNQNLKKTMGEQNAVALDLMVAASEIYLYCRGGGILSHDETAILKGVLEEIQAVRDSSRAYYEQIHGKRAPGHVGAA
ncbi:MAG: hypothetical protein ABSG56_38505 [Bryobacteraceae bacterium]|jgi:hypothetical protein